MFSSEDENHVEHEDSTSETLNNSDDSNMESFIDPTGHSKKKPYDCFSVKTSTPNDNRSTISRRFDPKISSDENENDCIFLRSGIMGT